MARVRPMLDGVPETLLWTLHNRAFEAGRRYPVLDDPMALQLLANLDYPFEERFGVPNAFHSQAQALRSRCFDLAVQEYLADRPEATVVALGDGLETGFWRVDNGRLNWLSVELPEVATLRRTLLPPSDRLRTLSGSATDLSWLDEIEDPEGRGVVVTTQGLLMYLRPAEVRGILAACAARLPGGILVLDSMGRWLARGTVAGTSKVGAMTIPPMRWAMDPGEREKLRGAHPGITEVRALRLPRGRGAMGELIRIQNLLPGVRTLTPAITQLRFGDRTPH
ncbi:class I SAM-dependent methyltransferase [Streptomyces sp. P01-B04]|uniref:class I SAM-dependent methyltransferase n=1 Tax=Streptomyces poriferorum TaxID=2798799 RepID=UPI001C5DE794|nr:class I SAM-dependent methyltransferase [Streptomyces poriferorum]MBW5248883.1 class I SAM-dependent methyltransferase [Streptomyces poriferorum]MBW5255554.1 class I SAM-dependent methyltransferase [Streptomyces poriferorum]